MTTDTVISKVWSFCHTLRDDGVGYGDYLEQLTFLLFLKMADEFGKPPHNRDVGVPEMYSWAQLRNKKGAEDTKSGAGQYFTPRALIQAMVACVQPEPNKLKGKSLADLDNLPEPEILAEEIIDNIEAGLNSFRVVAAALGK